MIAVEVRNLFYFLVGVFVFVFLYQLVRSISYFLQDYAPEMGLVYPVIFLPIVSIPFAIIGFAIIRTFAYIRKLNFSAKKWFLFGFLFSCLVPFLDVIFFKEELFLRHV